MVKVLVVDDEPSIASLLADIIEEQGYEVTIAFDGRQGYELAKTGAYNLVITDVMMPYVRGNELCARLKEQAATQTTPIILMSAVAHMAHLGRGCSADAFILKPFDISVITQIVEQYLKPTKDKPQTLALPAPEVNSIVHYRTNQQRNYSEN